MSYWEAVAFLVGVALVLLAVSPVGLILLGWLDGWDCEDHSDG